MPDPPADATRDGGTARRIPLELRGELGLVPALVDTLRLVWTAPDDFFARRSVERALWPPLLLGTTLHTMSALAGFVAAMATGIPEPLRALLASLPAEHAWIGSLLSTEARLAALAFAPVGYLVGWVGRGVVWWLGLAIARAARAPFREHLRSLAYCDGVELFGVLAAVPLVGGLIGLGVFLWRALLEVVAMRRLNDVPLWRVVVGPLVLAMLLGTLGCCVAAVFLWWATDGLAPFDALGGGGTDATRGL